MLDRLNKIHGGQLRLTDGELSQTFGSASDGQPTGSLLIRSPQAYRKIVQRGGLGAAESYIDGDWDTDDLVSVMRVFARLTNDMHRLESGLARLLTPLRASWHWMRKNTRRGSRQNISAHYDLSNDFFALMLDPTMTYSSGIFTDSQMSMEQASHAKYDKICRDLQLTPSDHVVEVGCGWGGFAHYAAANYGCRVTATTISAEQFAYARQRIRMAGLDDRVSIIDQDYRDLQGKYDKLVSIEMIEAVGERFLPTFFNKCCELLKDDGMMSLQAITIPDHRFDRYRRSIDFIQRYIFPGGFLPSVSAIGESLRKSTDFRLLHQVDFGESYAESLFKWREQFWRNLSEIRELGFDDRFIRTWHYYLCYCEAGFRERQIGVSHWLFAKPGCRRDAIVDV